MASDSIQPSIDAARRIHSHISGKLHKGHGIAAASASIPSKYQTIVTNNSDKKGFNSRAKRFSSDYYVTDAPGPGNYQCRHDAIEKFSTSYSKKGTGTFASKTKHRTLQNLNPTPGAGSYDVPSYLLSRKDFNKANSSSFHLPIAVTKDNMMISRSEAPAPNVYMVKDYSSAKNTAIAAEAAFKSRTKRQSIQAGNTRIPSPSHYNVQDNILKPGTKAPVSCFRSTTKRNVIEHISKVPGPGTYKPFETIVQPDKLILPRKHYLCISAPAMPLPAPVENPGPGTYELVDYEGPPKHYMSSSVFVSNTSRWSFGQLPSKENPGPATYRPERVGKQSFIYNANNRWIPL